MTTENWFRCRSRIRAATCSRSPRAGPFFVRDPHKTMVDEQLNGGKFTRMIDADWELILPLMEENENFSDNRRTAFDRERQTPPADPRVSQGRSRQFQVHRHGRNRRCRSRRTRSGVGREIAGDNHVITIKKNKTSRALKDAVELLSGVDLSVWFSVQEMFQRLSGGKAGQNPALGNHAAASPRRRRRTAGQRPHLGVRLVRNLFHPLPDGH